jgi:3-dehydroquinate dehydratase-2
MPKILIVHGAGMNMRGKSQIEIFGKMTLPEYDEHIRRYASELGFDVEIFHSNIEGEAINKFYAAHDANFDAAIINPAGFTTGYPALVAAIAQVKFPVIELHISNPARRGRESEIARATRGVVTGFGIYGYFIAMRGIKDILAAR